MSNEKLLPLAFERTLDQLGSRVVDAIVVAPPSRGRLYLPGEYSESQRQPVPRIHGNASNNNRVQIDDQKVGSAQRYHVVYDVTNRTNGPAFAQLELADLEP